MAISFTKSNLIVLHLNFMPNYSIEIKLNGKIRQLSISSIQSIQWTCQFDNNSYILSFMAFGKMCFLYKRKFLTETKSFTHSTVRFAPTKTSFSTLRVGSTSLGVFQTVQLPLIFMLSYCLLSTLFLYTTSALQSLTLSVTLQTMLSGFNCRPSIRFTRCLWVKNMC